MKIKGPIIVGFGVLVLTLFACSAGKLLTSEAPIFKQTSNPVNSINLPTNYETNYTASGKPYYHLSYALNSENLRKVDVYSWQEFEQNGGQFEVELEKSDFPIPAPKCKSNLILRMPWVPPNKDLSAKYQLYQAILAVHAGQLDKVSVVLELNPYVKETPQGIELTQCNIFFRHANAEYVPHTDSLN